MPFLTASAYAATTQFRGNIGAMVVDADPVVKFVMLILLIFSIFSWGIILQKWIGLSRARNRARVILEAVAKGGSMVKLTDIVQKTGDCPVAGLFREAQDEIGRMAGKTGPLNQSMLTNVEVRMANSQSRQSLDLTHGLGFLASISNASPFIGLFGTVGGIMDSFREIGLRGSANLATVAPGISEALIATAAGLFVAIPAVLFYNFFSGMITHVSGQMDQFQMDFMNWLRRGMLHADK
jgi:biopolymer transport protein TolQ